MTAAELSAEADELMRRVHELAMDAITAEWSSKEVAEAATNAANATRKLAALLKSKAEAEEKR